MDSLNYFNMTDKQITGNKLIINFVRSGAQYKKAEMYYEHEIAGGFPDYTGLKYHKDWNWLMPIVKKIQIDSPEAPEESSGWYAYYGMEPWLVLADINKVFEHCVQYIEWYNKRETDGE